MNNYLARLTNLRRHLLDNWEYADEWTKRMKSSNGAYCYVTHQFGNDYAIGFVGTSEFKDMHELLFNNRDSDILTESEKGKIHILTRLDHAIKLLGGL